MRHNIFKGITYAIAAVAALSMSSCLSNDDETIVIESQKVIKPSPNPAITESTTSVPNINPIVEIVDGTYELRIDMTGVKNPGDTEWLKLYGTDSPDQNIWVEVDGEPMRIEVRNNSDYTEGQFIMTDIVFTIDNSGSMGQEADAIARDIVSWAQYLQNNNLNARYGVVGYGEGPINGAINLTNVTDLSNYLNYGTGTGRTRHFGGTDATALQTAAPQYSVGGSHECGAAAIWFANDNFKFRSSANRIYVNFTDEPNQPNGKSQFSVEHFKDQINWPASNGTIHTVYSGTPFTGNEWPGLISDYTGGTTLCTTSNFTGVTLESLPVTGAMKNSYIIRFPISANLIDGKPHQIHITILTKDGKVQADKVFNVIFKTA